MPFPGPQANRSFNGVGLESIEGSTAGCDVVCPFRSQQQPDMLSTSQYFDYRCTKRYRLAATGQAVCLRSYFTDDSQPVQGSAYVSGSMTSHGTTEHFTQSMVSMDKPSSWEPHTGDLVPVCATNNSSHFGQPALEQREHPQPVLLAGPTDGTSFTPKPSRPKRGPYSDAALRKETAETRKIGSCIRCTMQRIRCNANPVDPKGECLTCSNLRGPPHRRFPCMRYKLASLSLIHPAYSRNHAWMLHWNSMLSSPARTPVAAQPRLIRISECLSSKYFEVYVREIVRAEIVGVTTSDLYPKYALGCGGNASSIPTAYAYALVDLNAVEEAFANYIPNITGSVLRRFVGPADSLLHKTYRMACQMCQDPTTPSDSKEILKSTFKLWTAVRLSTLPTFIVGDETLKMSQLALDQPQPLAGKINMPPVTSAQLEVVLVHYIQGTLRPSVLRKLQDMECRKKKDTWLVIYLATFILLHNITLLMAHGASEPLDCVTNRSVADTQEYLREANTLLAYFHYCSRGLKPLSESCKDSILRAEMVLDVDKTRFLHYSRAFGKQHEAHWRELKSHASYNHDYYFISQLFEENWQPRSCMAGAK